MDFDNPSEKELLKVCIQGNEDAWHAFVEKYTNLIYHTINRTLKFHNAVHLTQDSNDIHNDVFRSLLRDDYKKLRQYEGRNGCTVAGWLRIVTSNLTLNYTKKQRKYKLLEDDPPGPQDPPEGSIIMKEYKEILEELVKELNPKEILFYRLYYEEEHPPEKIAEIMGLKVGTVFGLKSRFIEKLKKIAKKKGFSQDN